MADLEVNLESTDSKELLKSGHRALLVKDYANAAAALGKATQIMAQEHGDEHDSLGEIYLHYARALLELSRSEATPIGDAIPQGDEDSDSDEGEDNEEVAAEEEGVTEGGEVDGQDKEENKDAGDKKEELKDEEKDKEEEKTEDKDDEKLENGEGKTDEASAGPSTSNGTTDEATDEATAEEAEPSDLQLAWEVLEVAKKIFTARGDSGKELLSQTLILLGEVGMESENFEDAAVDIQAGLELQESLYEKTSRKLAETQYKLAIAHATVSNLDEAIQFFEKSIATLEGRIELLKKTDDENSQKEITEIEGLMPEIKEKIIDMNEIKKERAKVVEELADACKMITKKAQDPKAETKEVTSSPKEVKDISHLVKRKRKIDNSETNEINPAKKPTP